MTSTAGAATNFFGQLCSNAEGLPPEIAAKIVEKAIDFLSQPSNGRQTAPPSAGVLWTSV